MLNTSYPAPLKNWLKATPSMMVFVGFSLLFPTILFNIINHPHERVERLHFRSNKFERIIRKRDDKLRLYYKPAIDYQPNDHQKIIKPKPLYRF